MIQPVGDKILVRKLKSQPESDHLVLPEDYISPEAFGEVVKIGTYMLTPKGTRHQNWPVAEGDKIVFNNQADVSRKVECDGEELLLMHISQVRAVISQPTC
jgi:co-chaperonin GroES (HSP10)